MSHARRMLNRSPRSGMPSFPVRLSWPAAVVWLAAIVVACPETARPAPPRPPLSVADARRLAADAEALVIDLSALAALEPEAARELARFSGVLDLSGLEELRPAVAEALAPSPGLLILTRVSVLTPEAAAALARCPGALDLSGLRSLPPDAIQALTAYRGPEVRLSPLVVDDAIDRPGLAALEAIPGVVVNDVNTMAGRCQRLSAVDVPLLRLLARTREWKGAVHAVTALDVTAAHTLARLSTWDGRLPAVRAIDGSDAVAVATALAGRTGPLALPALERISPRTLSALLEKVDVEIPRIETLELIAEPDGSPTDDFVIPKGFAERQRQAR
jgi:hypothetical protein